MTVINNWFQNTHIGFNILSAHITSIKEHIQNEIINNEVKESVLDKEYEKGSYEVLGTLSDNLRTIFAFEIKEFTIQSNLLLIYSILENDLKILCTMYSRDQKTNVALNDLEGKGIDKCKLFLTKVAQLEFNNDINTSWRNLKNYQELRNHLAHNSKLDQKKSRKIRSLQGATINNGKVALEFVALENFLSEIQSFYFKLWNNL